MSNREAYVEQGQEVIQLAWEIGGREGVADEMEALERVKNGLYAIAIVETMARPVMGRFGSIVSLRDVIKEDDDAQA